MNIRKIKKEDNKDIAHIVAMVMLSFGADPKTTIIGDPALRVMFENYQEAGAVYYIAEENGIVFGGAGIRKLEGSDENVCELQRMFLLPEARGKGLGKELMRLCLDSAKEFGYKKVYLESLNNMESALALYVKSGFMKIESQMGNTGHVGCNTFMIKEI